MWKACLIFLFICNSANAQKAGGLSVIAYYAGSNPTQIDSFPVEKLTHIIFSFCHLKGNELHVDKAADTLIIRRLVALKQRNPNLKVMFSLGGWGGCATCSPVFAVKDNRKAFAKSVKELCKYFGADGIDLDWEYPAIAGYPDHPYSPQDKQNFTQLVIKLRKKLGRSREISFAAGGFNQYINESVEWKPVMKRVDRVNLMTYDLVNGFSGSTGHHTPLYSTKEQIESIDNAVQRLEQMGVPSQKIAIGAAFYGRVWEAVLDSNSGLYQTGHFRKSVSFKNFGTELSADSGFIYHWDDKAMAPYLYNPVQHLFVTHDDKRSIALKTQYAVDKRLGGIMFWQLGEDLFTEGLLDAIDRAKQEALKKKLN
jgi:chitinase